ncbi:aldo/keto reductase [Streptomyces sp. NPDC004980]
MLGDSIPEGARARTSAFLSPDVIDDTYRERASALHELARERGQSLAQLALQWVLRRPQVTSALIGASSATTSAPWTTPRSPRRNSPSSTSTACTGPPPGPRAGQVAFRGPMRPGGRIHGRTGRRVSVVRATRPAPAALHTSLRGSSAAPSTIRAVR